MAQYLSHKHSLYPTHLALGLVATFILSAGGCAVRHTPPEPTPVYSEDLPQGAAPLAVERVSVNAPDPNATETQEESPQTSESVDTNAPPRAAKEEGKTQAEDSATTEPAPKETTTTPSAAAATPAKK